MGDEILIRYLSEETSNEENIQIERWLTESDENKKTLEDIYFVIEADNKLRLMQSVDVDRALLRFKQRLKEKQRKSTTKKVFRTLQLIAALLFLPTLGYTLHPLYSQHEGSNDKPENVSFVEMRTNSGMISSFTLPDGSKVWLNSNSCIRYPSAFNGDKREVEIEGQAYFEVVKNEEQPFIVQTKDKYALKVLGTTFNIAAYNDEDIIETTLVSGLLQVNVNNNNHRQTLLPNEKAVYTKAGEKLEISTVNSEYDIGWRTGQIIFKNHSMKHVLRILSRQYNVVFDVKNKHVYDSKITAKFDNEQLPQILEYLKLASGIKYKVDLVQTTDKDVNKKAVSLWL